MCELFDPVFEIAREKNAKRARSDAAAHRRDRERARSAHRQAVPLDQRPAPEGHEHVGLPLRLQGPAEAREEPGDVERRHWILQMERAAFCPFFPREMNRACRESAVDNARIGALDDEKWGRGRERERERESGRFLFFAFQRLCEKNVTVGGVE